MPRVWCELGEVRVHGMRVGCAQRALGRVSDGTAICEEHLRGARRCPVLIGDFALCGRKGVAKGRGGHFYCREHAAAPDR